MSRAIRRGCEHAFLLSLVACSGRDAARLDARQAPAPGNAPAAPSLRGDWAGAVVARGQALPMALHVAGADDARGQRRATLDAPDVALFAQRVTRLFERGDSVGFVFDDADGSLRFAGVRTADTLAGAVTLDAPTSVQARAPRMTWRMVRAPAPPPVPYATRELHLAARGATLAATLFLPRTARASDGRVPGIVILQGSSTNLRAQYAYQADGFARAGFAVLRFDKRGNGESTGDYRRATYDDLAADARVALDSLAAQPGVDRARVGVWGSSQGAFLAPLVARDARSSATPVAFVVAVSGPGMPIVESAAYQDSLHVAWAGHSPADAARAAATHRTFAAALAARVSGDSLSAVLRPAADAPWRRLTGLTATAPPAAERDGFYYAGRTIDPTAWWRVLRVPVLLVYGEADELVPARASAARIVAALRAGGNRDVTLRTYPRANHVLKLVPTPLAPANAERFWPVLAPGYEADVRTWLRAHAQSP